MDRNLKNNIGRLYQVFSKYPGNAHMSGSPMYTDVEKWNKALFSKPLRELTHDDLSLFAGKVITTWGEADDLKHFLPRILELTAQWQTPYDIWILFDKLQLADWKNWPADEQELVKEYMLLLWENLLSSESPDAEWEFKHYFGALAHYYPRFDDLIQVWNRNTGRQATKFLAWYIFEESQNIFDKGIIFGFYNQSENAAAFIDWLLSYEVVNRLEKAYFTYADEDFAETISWAEKILSNERVNRAHQRGS